ncbi:RidA family protein [Idiomarina sp. UBA4206]|mgnify:FL=1|uniref:RidA family protein n=1 Tax=Idiomarina sp. UBA4206 TaxID=1946644 RepID=UPI00257F670F|nr:RidA family protein [Idiomarina sp. UBA4206]|tara:strand:+ start:245 stop:625 length:381 start_codon:yes stop_codon:yes gene_type:complete
MYNKTIISTDLAPAAVGTYSQGVIVGDTYYFSGQIGIDPATGILADSFGAQLRQTLNNIDGLLKSQHLDRSNIIKTTIFLTDLNNFAAVNEAYKAFFKEPYPARSCVEASALPKGAVVEIEVLAAK